jgi:sulfopyruvate decarboxylase subunit beta
MKRIEVIKTIAEKAGLVVCTLGLPSRELYSLHDKPSHFYMLGSMGMASSVGLGLAIAQKKKVYVIDGDGSILMNLGSLATIAHYAPSNYCLIIIDNGSYGSTGNQPTLTAGKTDLEKIARGAGIARVTTAKNMEHLHKWLDSQQDEPLVIIAKTDTTQAVVPHVPLLPRAIKKRFLREVAKGTLQRSPNKRKN